MFIQRQAKVVTSGDPQQERMLLVLHGYGQLSNYFIRKFEMLSNDYFIVAPEGPHRFYLEGFSGRVGASWMTKELREWDIADNVNYLNQVVEKYGAGKKISLIGFSQGGATAARFIQKGKHAVDHFVLWASDFPEDVSPIQDKAFQNVSCDYAIGSEDVFFKDESFEQSILKHKALGFEVFTFEGKHDIDGPTLLHILNNR